MTEGADEHARGCERYVERNPAIMGGEPVIRGTRVPVRTVAGLIEQGESREIMREDYSQVQRPRTPSLSAVHARTIAVGAQ